MIATDAPNHSQCRLRLPFAELAEGQWRLTDRLELGVFDRDGHELYAVGRYLDM